MIEGPDPHLPSSLNAGADVKDRPDRSGGDEQSQRQAAAQVGRRERGALDANFQDKLESSPSAMGEAVVAAIMAYIRSNSRRSKKAYFGLQKTVVAGMLLARALHRQKAREPRTQSGELVHLRRPPGKENPIYLEVVRDAHANAGDPALEGQIRAAIEANPNVSQDVKGLVSGPDGGAAIEGALAGLTTDQVEATLRSPGRQEELIDALSKEWTNLGFDGEFEDAWKYARHNPAIGTPGEPAVGEPGYAPLPAEGNGGWERFAGADLGARPTQETLDYAVAALASATVPPAVETGEERNERLAVRATLEGVVFAKWEPEFYEAMARDKFTQGLEKSRFDPTSAYLDPISPIENASVHVGVGTTADENPEVRPTDGWRTMRTDDEAALREARSDHAAGATFDNGNPKVIDGETVPRSDTPPPNLAEVWQRVSASGDTMRSVDPVLVEDLVDALSVHTARQTPLSEPAGKALEAFGRELSDANPALGAEFGRLRSEGLSPVQAYREMGKHSSGHPFDPESVLRPAEKPAEKPAHADKGRETALEGVKTPADLAKVDSALPTEFNPTESKALTRYPKAQQRTAELAQTNKPTAAL